MDYIIVQCQAAFAGNGGILMSLFLAGLVGSVHHCTGMCGPFVVAQIKDPAASGFSRLQGGALLPYHLGRITTYMILGIIGASLSNYIIGTPMQRGIAVGLLTVAGLLFLSSAVPQIKALVTPGGTQRLASSIGRYVGMAARPFSSGDGSLRQYFLGTMLGFLPCTLVMAAVMAVASTGQPVTAVFGMLFFGAGTVPALFMVGCGAHAALKRWPVHMQKITTGMMALNGVGLIALAGGMVF